MDGHGWMELESSFVAVFYVAFFAGLNVFEHVALEYILQEAFFVIVSLVLLLLHYYY